MVAVRRATDFQFVSVSEKIRCKGTDEYSLQGVGGEQGWARGKMIDDYADTPTLTRLRCRNGFVEHLEARENA